MVGGELLVAPALAPGATAVRVYLPDPAPAAQWVSLWTGEAVGVDATPGFVQVPAPLGQPPVLFRAGSAVGLQAQAAVGRCPKGMMA